MPLISIFGGGSLNGRLSRIKTAVAAFLSDGFFSSVSLLLHMDGVNNGTVFTDQKGTAITRAGLPVTSTAQFKFGTASGLFGQNQALTFPVIALTSDFTVEGWFYITAVSASGYCIAFSAPAAGNVQLLSFDVNGKIGYYNQQLGTSAASSGYSATGAYSLNAWTHCALVRSGTAVKLYVNGVSVASGTDSTTFNISTLGGFVDGISGYNINGYVDDVRITKGVARYVSNFTPPTAAFLDL